MVLHQHDGIVLVSTRVFFIHNSGGPIFCGRLDFQGLRSFREFPFVSGQEHGHPGHHCLKAGGVNEESVGNCLRNVL